MFGATGCFGGRDTQGQAEGIRRMTKFPLRLDRDLFLKLKVSVASIVDVSAEVTYSEEKITSPTEANDDQDLLDASSMKKLPTPSKKSKAE